MPSQIIPFKLSHLSSFFPVNEQKEEYGEFLDNLLECGVLMINNPQAGDYAFTVIDDNHKILAICGSQRDGGVDVFWSFVGQEATPHQWSGIMRVCRRILGWLFKKGATRVEVSIRDGYENAKRAMDILGFKKYKSLNNGYSLYFMVH